MADKIVWPDPLVQTPTPLPAGTRLEEIRRNVANDAGTAAGLCSVGVDRTDLLALVDKLQAHITEGIVSLCVCADGYKIIEKVARAICESVGPEGSSDARSQMGDWPAWHDWVPQARAAIQCLADNVTPEMVFAFRSEWAKGRANTDQMELISPNPSGAGTG